MSAGKGSKPRPVNTRTYAANYDAIFRKTPPYPDWICAPCGQAHGRGMPAGHIATWHEGICDICRRLRPKNEAIREAQITQDLQRLSEALALLNKWRECAVRLAGSIALAPVVPTNSMKAALAEFDRLQEESK